jgi:hypothetical protein
VEENAGGALVCTRGRHSAGNQYLKEAVGLWSHRYDCDFSGYYSDLFKYNTKINYGTARFLVLLVTNNEPSLEHARLHLLTRQLPV